jgi:hydrogenase/urease accessory protein HupE
MARVLAACVALALLLVAHAAAAHDPGISRGSYQLEGGVVTAELTFSHDDFSLLGRALGFADTWEAEGETDEVAETIVAEGLRVTADGAECPGHHDRAETLEGALAVRARFECPTSSPEADVRVEVALLSKLPAAHQHVAQRAGGTQLLTQAAPSFALTGDAGEQPRGFTGFLVSGVEHILFGFDHLVFLLGLVLIGKRLRGVILAVTAFTLAHSITLGLAVLKVWAPSGDVVEPLIALSVAYVGVENFFVDDADKRWRVTLPFGLVHGFGFAGALGEIQLPAPEIPTALLAFNLGVELGQLAVLAVLLPILLNLHKREFFAKNDRGVRVLSAAVVAAGLFWFVTRIVAIIG